MPKKNKDTKKVKLPSELRFDLGSRDWVIIATGRARRPETFKKAKRKEQIPPEGECPFCQIKNQKKPTLVFFQGRKIFFKKDIPEDWTVAVVPNKFPAFLPYLSLNRRVEGGLYERINAAGFHEVVITRSHSKQMAQLSVEQIKEVIDVYQQRYLELMPEKFVNHISIFHNQGREAGATISHSHSQIITTPLVDVDVNTALLNARSYLENKKKCMYCRMNSWERKVKKRIVFENKEFLALCPFASKTAFEVIISPKKHLSYFEKINEREKRELAEAFKAVLSKIYKGLNNPAYNFYLHTAPCDDRNYDFYHWHWTFLPKTSIWAGFEIGTEMEISVIEPEKAAEYLRKQ